MPSSAGIFVFCNLIVCSCTLPILSDFHMVLPKNVKEVEKVKRGADFKNADAQLKQVSFQSLIGDLEESLFGVAMSVSGVALDEHAVVEHVTPYQEEHTNRRRNADLTAEATEAIALASDTAPASKKILLQTTERVPSRDGIPAHVVIDRISVLPHHGGVSLIPHFEVKHTKLVTTTIEENILGNSTEISITKTDSTSSNRVSADSVDQVLIPVTSEAPENLSQVSSSKTTMETIKSTPEVETPIPTTKTPIIKLKEAEKELKVKVAEIEADPVILSARI